MLPKFLVQSDKKRVQTKRKASLIPKKQRRPKVYALSLRKYYK